MGGSFGGDIISLRWAQSPRYGGRLRPESAAIDECGEVPPASNHIPPGVKAVTVKQWRDYAYRQGVSASDEPRARQAAFQRAHESLVAGRQVPHNDKQSEQCSRAATTSAGGRRRGSTKRKRAANTNKANTKCRPNSVWAINRDRPASPYFAPVSTQRPSRYSSPTLVQKCDSARFGHALLVNGCRKRVPRSPRRKTC